MDKHPLPPAHKEAIALIEKLQRVGFPNRDSIKEMETLVQKLHALSPQLEHLHQISIQQIDGHIQKIKKALQTSKELPVPMYSALYAQLVIFDTNLYLYL